MQSVFQFDRTGMEMEKVNEWSVHIHLADKPII